MGMHEKHAEPLVFPSNSSEKDTLAACDKYGIKRPSLNADLFECLLRKTSINVPLLTSMVRGSSAADRPLVSGCEADLRAN